ncbi:MAG TPA: type II toxin-antitoxin system HicB family antitoxin [Dehalococcoidia bacterium]|nr:type II toxin-antitoxin system HicB family antitoxin [Dehalococcoidia bacterium]
MKTYIFKVEFEQDDDGRWSADIPTLPGCATWGYTKEEALEALHEAAQAYLEVLFEDGRSLPKEAEETTKIVEETVVAITV